MSVISSEYENLTNEIQILEWMHQNLLDQLRRNRREVWGHLMPLPKSLNRYDNIRERIAGVEQELEVTRKLKGRIDKKLSDLTGMQHTVYRERVVDGLSLQEIAEKHNCSYSYISKLSSRANSAKRVKDGIAK